MPLAWDSLEDACGVGPSSKEEQYLNKIRSAAIIAHHNKFHVREIPAITNYDPDILELTAQSFRHDFHKFLPQDVRDIVSYIESAHAHAIDPAQLLRFDGEWTNIEDAESYKQHFLKDTQFIINVSRLAADPTSAVKKWTCFLEFLGDAYCGFLQELYFHFEGVAVSVSIRPALLLSPDPPPDAPRKPRRQAPMAFNLFAESDSFLKQNDADYHQAIDSLRQNFTQIATHRREFWGPSRFAMRDINKIGKVVFRLPALCCWLQSQRRGKKVKGREDSGAELVTMTALDAPVSPSCFVTLPTEMELREHAGECGECNCAWVRRADGAL